MEWKLCRHFTLSPSSCHPLFVVPSLARCTNRTLSSLLKISALIARIVVFSVHYRGFHYHHCVDQQGFSGAQVCRHKRCWVRTMRRSKLRVCGSSILFSQIISLLGRFRSFCVNSWSVCLSVELWVRGQHRRSQSSYGRRAPGCAFSWQRPVDVQKHNVNAAIEGSKQGTKLGRPKSGVSYSCVVI